MCSFSSYFKNPYSITDTPAPDFDMEKVKTTIKQFYRDWSKEVRRDE